MDNTINDDMIKRAQADDERAFEQLITHSYDRIYRCALRWSGHRTNAEDIAQIACIKVAKNIKQFRFDSAFNTWLYRIVINCAKDWYRRDHRHNPSQDLERINGNECESPLASQSNGESSILLRQILRMLDDLGEGFKETVILVHAEGLSHKEAAEVLELKESTISWRLHRVRKHLHSLPEYEQNTF